MYRIRCRVAEPGTTITPPDTDTGSAPEPLSRRRKQDWKSASEPHQADEEAHSEDSDSDWDSDSSSDKNAIEFVPEECLFCNHTSKDFGDSLLHMHRVHSLVVPFQSSLAVDLQTLTWFLHMIIFGYRECICCGKRRRTIEAVQQHMTSAGHCRFNVTEDMGHLYRLDSLGQEPAESRNHPDEHTLRLPSGKLLAHRSYVDPAGSSKGRLRLGEKPSAAGASASPASQPSSSTIPVGSQALTKADQKEQALTAQFAQLRAGDRMSLMHLPQSQQRSLLLAHKKQLDQAKRAERRSRGRMDHVGNRTAIHTNYYKQEVPVYQGG